jgi:hypothetical protein
MGELAVMGRQGDLKVIWDRTKADEVEHARKTFDDMRAKGYLAYSVKGKDGSKDEQITRFDPDAERIILAAPMRGGA